MIDKIVILRIKIDDGHLGDEAAGEGDVSRYLDCWNWKSIVWSGTTEEVLPDDDAVYLHDFDVSHEFVESIKKWRNENNSL